VVITHLELADLFGLQTELLIGLHVDLISAAKTVEVVCIFLLAFAAVWPILLNTAAGVKQLDARWLQLARSLSASRWETLTRVVIPGVLGHVLTGVRLAIGILWIVLVPCEMLGVSAGLGYYILDTRDRLAYSELMAMVLLIGVLGFLLDATARGLYARWSHGAGR
jgi:NitT/TauT family transport system permease protein